ncbi:ATP-dependent RNA helicase RhlB, partial [Striga asiatica]
MESPFAIPPAHIGISQARLPVPKYVSRKFTGNNPRNSSKCKIKASPQSNNRKEVPEESMSTGRRRYGRVECNEDKKKVQVFTCGFFPRVTSQRLLLSLPAILLLLEAKIDRDLWKGVCVGGCSFSMTVSEKKPNENIPVSLHDLSPESPIIEELPESGRLSNAMKKH